MHRVRTVATGVPGSPWYVNVYFNDDEGRTAQEAADAMRSFWQELRLALATGVTYTVDPDVAGVNAFSGETETLTTVETEPVLGGAGVPALPFATQGLIRLNTNGVVRGRRVQGRIFVPGVAQAGTANGQPPPTFVAGMTTAAALLLDDLPNVQPVVWSRPNVPFPGPGDVGGSEHPVVSAIGRNKYGILASRRD